MPDPGLNGCKIELAIWPVRMNDVRNAIPQLRAWVRPIFSVFTRCAITETRYVLIPDMLERMIVALPEVVVGL